MAFNQPFDLEFFLVNTLSGSIEIFLGLAFLVIAALSARFRMPNAVTLTFFALFIVMLSYYTGGLYLLILLIGSVFVAWGILRIVKA